MGNVIENGNYCVYVHTSPSGKKYVGQTGKTPEDRWRYGCGYLYKNEDGEYKQPAFARAILKYGWENIEHEIIASNLTKEEADNFEKLLIKELDTMNPKYGYNCKEGGSNCVLSEESRKKISDAHKGEKHHMFGKHHSEETKRKISESHKGLKMSEETRRKLSEYRRGENSPMYGKHHSEESRRKISENQKNKRIGADSPLAKKVVQYDLNGIVVKNWGCINDVRKEIGINISNIIKCCKRNPRYKTVGGYIWRYAEDVLTEEEIVQCQNGRRTGKVRIIQYTISGEFVCVFDSVTEAELKTGIPRKYILRCCRNERNHTGGFIWRYYDDIKEELKTEVV